VELQPLQNYAYCATIYGKCAYILTTINMSYSKMPQKLSTNSTAPMAGTCTFVANMLGVGPGCVGCNVGPNRGALPHCIWMNCRVS
jgi:hypothetical protein